MLCQAGDKVNLVVPAGLEEDGRLVWEVVPVHPGYRHQWQVGPYLPTYTTTSLTADAGGINDC